MKIVVHALHAYTYLHKNFGTILININYPLILGVFKIPFINWINTKIIYINA